MDITLGFEVTIDPAVRRLCLADLSNGGRGIELCAEVGDGMKG